MSDNYISIVPVEEEYPYNQKKSQAILEWFISRDIVKPNKSDCVLGADYGYSVSNGASKVVKYPEELPFDLITNGLEIVTESQVFDPGEFYEEGQELPESNLGFIFWNWPELSEDFINDLELRLGMKVHVIPGRI